VVLTIFCHFLAILELFGDFSAFFSDFLALFEKKNLNHRLLGYFSP